MHNKSIEETYQILKTGQTGLESCEIEQRQAEYGKNVINKQKKQSLLAHFFAQFKNAMVIILLFSAVVSISIAITHKEVYELIEGGVILFIVIMNAIIGVIQENKAQACLDELEKKTASHITVVRDGKEQKILSEDVVVGDLVILEAGDVVPADIRLIETKGLSCDESSLTGESIACEKNCDETLPENASLGERKNIAYGGSLVTAGHGKGVVFAVGNKSEIGKIAQILTTSKKELTPLQQSIAKIGKFITITVLSACVCIFLLELFCVKDGNFVSALMTSVALAVAAIPESLPAVITLIMAMGVQQLAKRKVIIKQLHAVETLGSCQIICSDKTGTLTQNKMQVVELSLASKNDKTSLEFKKAINCLYLCNQAKIVDEQIVAEATEKAIFEYALKYYDGEKRERLKEIPFDSTRKMMTTLNNDGGLVSYTKGAFDRIVEKCKFYLSNGEVKELNNDKKAEICKKNDDMASNALRVLALACKFCDGNETDTELENNLVLIGLVGLRDEPRKEAKDAIKKCFKAGLKPIMITGDHKLTAFAIAKELGIASNINQVLTGDEINKMNDSEFNAKIKDYTVFARVSPEHKVKIVKAYKNMKKVVAMTGDGVNDAPSLKIADIGVGMGITGTEVAKSVSDMIVTDDNFSSIVVAVEEGRKVYSNIQKALQYLISTNAVEIFGMLFALIFFPNYTFLLPSQMLFINLITDSLPAFALGVENVEPEVMQKPPRKPKSNIFAGEVGVGIVYQAILQIIIVITMYSVSIRLYTPDVACSMVFFTIIWMQLLHSINCKTNQSIIGKKLTDNKTFNICFIITFIINFAVCALPICHTIFGLSSLNFSQWIWVFISAFSIIPLCEIVKLFINTESNKYKMHSKKHQKKSA